MSWIDSTEYWLHREEEIDRREALREEALERHFQQILAEAVANADEVTLADGRTLLAAATERICDYCGQIGGDPVEVDDNDPNVGYHAIEMCCKLCAPRAQ